MFDTRKPSGRIVVSPSKRPVRPPDNASSRSAPQRSGGKPPPPTLKKKAAAAVEARERKADALRKGESTLRSAVTSLALLAAATLVFYVWWMVVIVSDNVSINRIESRVRPMFESGTAFVGIEFAGDDGDKLVAFSPSQKTKVEICRLTQDNIAAVSPDKTRLLFLRKMPARTMPDHIFNRSDYWMGMLVFDATTGNIGYVSRGLTAKPMTAGYGATGIWGGSNDRVFFSMIRKPEFYEQIEGISFLEALRKPVFTNNVYNVDRRDTFTTLPRMHTLRDVLFLPGETWYVSSEDDAGESTLCMMTDDRYIAVEKTMIDKPRSVIDLTEGNIGLLCTNVNNPASGGAIYAYDRKSGDMRIVLETRTIIRRVRMDVRNGLLFFVQIEDYVPEPTDNEPDPSPAFRYGMYRVELGRLATATKPLGMGDIERIMSVSRGGNSGFFDLDTRNRRIIFKEKDRLVQTDYDGGSREELWMPEGARIQWIQIMYGQPDSQ